MLGSCSTATHSRLRLSQQHLRLQFHPKHRGQVVRCTSTVSGAAVTQEDRQYIRQALELAKRALGKTYPNPAVGCVIVKDGQAVGEGYHPKAGMPHAEVYALRAAGNAAPGATAYVTLEPCNHYGRTPPCSQALVDAGVARVVIGVGDPNPLVAAAGIATLEKAGISVSLVGGQEEQECYNINEEFMKRMRQQAAATSAQRQ
eukprot:GHUV01009677.1.p1 GENE.GHUV01009677.1~~GHUV01009677.1.p1  ORF type:complete len:202 (+),score=52.14 GHUV01009677.1:150-755(+)